jgi:glycosyltransferase involved in cell wall biosynthesis
MKILYHHRIASKDGQFVHIEELTHSLRKRGHELVIVGPAVVDQDQFGGEGGLVAKLKRYLPKFVYELMEFGYAFVAYRKLVRAVREHRPDCLYERYNLYLPAGVWLKRRFGLPMLLEVNAPIFEERSKYHGIALPRFARWTETFAWRGADRVLPVTGVLARRVIDAGVPEHRIAVIPNGIDWSKFGMVPDRDEAKSRLGLSGRVVLGFTGFMREWHGLERVVDLIAQHRHQPWHLLLVGEGPARASIEQRARELNVQDRVTLTGVVARDKVADYVAAFDVALQPDVVDYASPLKLFEYLALARAVVAPDKPNIREVLTHDVNALLFDANDSGSFVAAIERLAGDEALRARLAREARATVERDGYTWDRNAERVEQLFVALGVREASRL